MKTMNKNLKNIFITVLVLSVAFVVSLLFQHLFNVEEHITTLFVFAVFFISMVTDGYFYGVLSAFISVLAVNYAFTFPYFALNFTTPVNLISAIVMIVIAILTGTLTTKIKYHEAVKAESERERMRANLLRAVSHDLRTPLTTIYGSSCTLLENTDNLSVKQQKVILEGIKEDSEWLVHMVENLLSITRIDSGNVKIIKTPTVVEELIDAVVIKFNKRYPQQSVTIDIPDEILIVPMDAILIEQVMINVLENAVQHAELMTTLSIRVFRKEEQVVFEIEDNGCGIESDKLRTILNGNTLGEDKPADGNRRNAGIGLSVCRTIIKAHGGDFTAENVKSGGAVFRFTLMIDKEEQYS